MEKVLNDLCSMPKIAETDIKKGVGSSQMIAIQNKLNFKRKKGNTWKMKKGKAKDEIHKPNPPMPNARPTIDAECFHYKGKRH